MIVGFDYWQVLSHYPEQVRHLIEIHERAGDTVHVVSAIGPSRVGTLADEVGALTPIPSVHEVVFHHPKESPVLKLAKCTELGIELFYDDREDVCRLLNRHGILAVRVPRRGDVGDDLTGERL
jgi:acid phosphatase class B